MVDLNVNEVKYYPKGTILEFKPHYDYSNVTNNVVPYHLRNLVPKKDEFPLDYNARQFINAAGTYDKAVSGSYKY
jgi:hypothetical protein